MTNIDTIFYYQIISHLSYVNEGYWLPLGRLFHFFLTENIVKSNILLLYFSFPPTLLCCEIGAFIVISGWKNP